MIILDPPDNPQSPPHLIILNLTTSAKSHFLCKATHLQISEVRTWISCGGGLVWWFSMMVAVKSLSHVQLLPRHGL